MVALACALVGVPLQKLLLRIMVLLLVVVVVVVQLLLLLLLEGAKEREVQGTYSSCRLCCWRWGGIVTACSGASTTSNSGSGSMA